MARRNRKIKNEENITQDVEEKNQNLNNFIDEINKEFEDGEKINTETKENVEILENLDDEEVEKISVEPIEEIIKDVPQEVIQPKKQRTINELSSVELRMYRRTGIFPK